MHRFLIFISLIGVAIAAAPQPCCTPKQWQGVVEVAGVNVLGKGMSAVNTTYTVLMHASYDYTNGRIRVDEDVIAVGSGTKTRITIIGDFKKAKKIYTIFNGKCSTVSINTPLPEACVPKNSSFYMGGTLGASLKYNTFAYAQKDGSLGAIIDVSEDGCIPIAELAFQKTKVQGKDNSAYIAAWFKNITAGIKDASIFNRPKQCKASAESENIVVDFNYLKYFHSRMFSVARANNMYLDESVEKLFHKYSIETLHRALLF